MIGWWLGPSYLLGQVNFGIDAAAILGILLAAGGGGFFALRSLRPELSREQDIVIAAISLLCGLILIFKGWELNQIHEFNQFLLTGVAVALAVETIRLRAATVEQAKRRTPTVDRKRRTSRVYRAELDEIEPYYYEDEMPREDRRRLKGTAVARPSRDEYFDDGDEYFDDNNFGDNDEPEDYRERSERLVERPPGRPRRRTRPDATRASTRRPDSQRQYSQDRFDAWGDDGDYSERDDRPDDYRVGDRDRNRPRSPRDPYRDEPEIDFGREDGDWRESPRRGRQTGPARDTREDRWEREERPASRDRGMPSQQEERPPIPPVARPSRRSRPSEAADGVQPPAADRPPTAPYASYEPLEDDYDLGDSEY